MQPMEPNEDRTVTEYETLIVRHMADLMIVLDGLPDGVRNAALGKLYERRGSFLPRFPGEFPLMDAYYALFAQYGYPQAEEPAPETPGTKHFKRLLDEYWMNYKRARMGIAESP